MSKAIIIGAGIAGIATSIRLASKGYVVEVFEANNYPGGKLTSFEKEGFRFDAGPSLFTLPNLVTELFELCGENSKDHFTYQRKDTVCNYFWGDGKTFVMPGNIDAASQMIATEFGEELEVVKGYLKRGKKKYKLTNSIFIEKSLHKVSTFLSKETANALLNSGSLDISKSLDKLNSQTFSNNKLIQLFNRYATYNGSSPYKTPGIMSMIPHLEMKLGTYFPDGGMHNITNSLVKLAERQGVKFHYNKLVNEIVVEHKRATGIKIENNIIQSDVVISNMDIFSSYKKLLSSQKQPERILNQERSSSALIFYWGVDGNFPELDLHNILFSNDYKAEFESIFSMKTIYQDPTVYINISSKCNPSDAPKEMENWFVMINTPGDSGQDWDKLIDQARKNILAKLSDVLKINLAERIRCETILDPRLIEQKTQSHQGSLYGTSSNSKFSAFLRHPNFSHRIKNLYFVGGSVHPGGGIPLCLNSAKIVGNLL